MDLKPVKGWLCQERGFVLMMTYFMLTVLTIVAIAIFSQGINFIQNTDRNRKRVVAFNIAEAGFDNTFLALKNGTITAFPYTSGYHSMDSGSVRGGYSVDVTDVGGNIRKIVSTGYSPAQTSTTETVESRTVTGYVAMTSQPLFDYGAFGDNSLTMNGNAEMDSYDSSQGAYGSGNLNLNGQIGTNGTANGSITLTGNTTVNGNAKTGVGSNPNTAVTATGNAVISGTKSAMTVPKSMPAVSTSIASSGDLTLSSNQTYTLPAGTYRFSSIQISGNAELRTTGPVTIYVDGFTSISGNGVSTAGNTPSNFILYSRGTSVSFSGNSNFYGAIYAPDATAHITGNGSIYGSVIAENFVDSGNGNIHYDSTLQNVASAPVVTVKSWHERTIADATPTPTPTPS